MKYVYFRTYAKEIGCENVDELGDLAIWKWIQEYQKITVWERKKEKTEIWEFNHISNRYDVNTTTPMPNCDLQKKAWSGGTWRGIEARLNCYNEVLEPLEILV